MKKSKTYKFLAKALGEENFESLIKADLFKIKTETVASLDEIFIGLKIVPHTVMAMLRKELTPMKEGDSKRFKLPTEDTAVCFVTKFSSDVYSGDITQGGKILAVFKYRTLPGVGLVIMSTFELYDTENFTKDTGVDPVKEAKIQKEIEDAIHKKPDQAKADTKVAMAYEHNLGGENNHGTPLKDFVSKKDKVKKSHQVINLSKSDTINCSDCGMKLLGEGLFSGCICLGQDRNKKVYLHKSEAGLKISFSRGWDLENIKLVLEELRKKKGAANE